MWYEEVAENVTANLIFKEFQPIKKFKQSRKRKVRTALIKLEILSCNCRTVAATATAVICTHWKRYFFLK